MFKKLICVLMICIVIVTTIASAAKITFKDVENHWAKDAIYEMVDKKVILGMGDGTFAPNNEIIKSHAFLMFSRLMGFYEEENKDIIKQATEEYSKTLKQNNITQGIDEISYLIKTEIISMEDIIDILGNGKEKEKLTREESAYIFVKLLNDEKSINQYISEIFADTEDIDEKYVRYVEYVKNINLMLGMDEKNFVPKGYVTRAQVATILNRIDKIIYERELQQIQGEIKNISGNEIVLIINEKEEKYEITGQTIAYKDEESLIKISDLKENDFIEIFVKNDGTIDRIYLKNREKNIYGIFAGYEVNPETKIVEKIYLLKNDVKYEYKVSEKVIVNDNEKIISISNIPINENIEIYVFNDKVIKITIGKIYYKEKGMIEQITIGSNNYLKIKNDKGESKEYKITENAKYDFDGAEGNIYDLRLNMDVEITVITDGIENVKVETLTNIEILTGIVERILPKIYVFTIKDTTGQVLMMFLDEEETVIKTKNGIAKDITDIKQGDLVSIYGRYEGDVFYPIQVIIYNGED